MQDLHVAAYNAWDDAALEILAAGAAVDARDEIGHTPLHWACFRGAVADQRPLVRVLARAGADLNALTADGADSPLLLAIQCDVLPLVKALVEAGADVNLAPDGVTPLMWAARQADGRMISFLLAQGADPTASHGGHATAFTAADYARAQGRERLARRLEAACATWGQAT